MAGRTSWPLPPLHTSAILAVINSLISGWAVQLEPICSLNKPNQALEESAFGHIDKFTLQF